MDKSEYKFKESMLKNYLMEIPDDLLSGILSKYVSIEVLEKSLKEAKSKAEGKITEIIYGGK